MSNEIDALLQEHRSFPPSDEFRRNANANDESVYDVTDRTGALIDRVQLPAGRTLVGFGPGGIVYVATRDGGATKIEKHLFK